MRVENQLVSAYEMQQNVTLECRSEAFPMPITYWMTHENVTISNVYGNKNGNNH